MNLLSKTTIVLLFTLLFADRLNAQWEKMGNIYGGNYSLAAGSGKLIAYGRGMGVHISIDTAKNWRKLVDSSNNPISFSSIYVHNNKIFAPINRNITISKDNGRTWFSAPQNFRGGTIYDLIIADGSIYATVMDSLQTTPLFSVHKFNETTEKWELQSQFPTNTMTFAVSDNKIYAYALSGFFVSNKATIQWVRQADAPINYTFYKDVVKITASDQGVVVTDGLFFQASSDGGVTWKQPFGLIGALACVVYKNQKFYSIFGSSGADARNWTSLFSPSTGWKDFSSADSDNTRIVLADNTIYMSYGSIGFMSMNVNEQIWRYLPSTPQISSTRRLVKLSENSILSSGDPWNEYLYKSNDKGRTWTPIGSIPYVFNGNGAGPIKDIISKGKYVFMNAGLDGYNPTSTRMVRSEDYGTTWQYDANFPIFSDFEFKGDTLFVIGSSNSYESLEGIRYALPPYTSWNTVTTSNAYGRLVFVGDTIIATTKSDSIVRVAKNGTLLSVPKVYLGFRPMNMITKNGKIYASNVDSLYISSDLGLTWKSKPFIRKKNSSHSTFYIASYNDVLIAMPNEKTGPFISKDDGNTWIPFNLGLPQNIDYNISSYFIDDKYIYISCGVAGIYRRLISDTVVYSYTGIVYDDTNNNGVLDVSEQPYPNAVVFTKKTNAIATSDRNGYYILETEPTPNDTIGIRVTHPYHKVSPQFHIPNRIDSNYNFAVNKLRSVKDLRITATAITPPRPGFEHTIVLTYENIGTTALFQTSPAVSFVYDSKVQFISATTPPTATALQSLTWQPIYLAPSDKKSITLKFKTPTNIPLNTVLTNIAKIEPIVGDTVPIDNIDTLIQTVVGSFDPNDKQVNAAKSYDIRQLKNGKPFIYTIRFQNTGNYPATFVRILDTLSKNLDMSTIQILDASHPMVFTARKKGILDFYFENINLPDSISNEAGSHGFVKFSIKPVSTLALNDVIENKAYIYFDYNEPVITNTVANKIVSLNAVANLTQLEILNAAPNPTNGVIYFQVPTESRDNNIRVTLWDITGKKILDKVRTHNHINELDLSNYKDGFYLLLVEQEDRRYIAKIVLAKN